MSIFNCCKTSRKYVIYVSGSNENKERFLKEVFGMPMKDLSFAEYKVALKDTEVFLQVVKDEELLNDIDEMHSKMANAIILLKDKDERVSPSKKPVLFVLVNGNSIFESEGNVIVKSANNNDLSGAKSSVEELVNFIQSHKP